MWGLWETMVSTHGESSRNISYHYYHRLPANLHIHCQKEWGREVLVTRCYFAALFHSVTKFRPWYKNRFFFWTVNMKYSFFYHIFSPIAVEKLSYKNNLIFLKSTLKPGRSNACLASMFLLVFPHLVRKRTKPKHKGGGHRGEAVLRGHVRYKPRLTNTFNQTGVYNRQWGIV